MSDEDFPVQPSISPSGVPYCTREECGSYDGKRCRAMGFRPDTICEPAVEDMAKLLLKYLPRQPATERPEGK